MKSDIVQVSFFCIDIFFSIFTKENELNIKRKYFALYNENEENFHSNNLFLIGQIFFKILISIHDEVAK